MIAPETHALQQKAFIRSLRRRATLWQEATWTVCSIVSFQTARRGLRKLRSRSTGRSVIKDADCKPTSVPRKCIKVGPVLLEDRPVCMVMVPVYDVALAVATFVIVRIDFP